LKYLLFIDILYRICALENVLFAPFAEGAKDEEEEEKEEV
jgi:hypothetical protein